MILNHEHDWRWNVTYIDAGGDPVHCGKYDGGPGIPRKCSATLTMQELIDRANAFECIAQVMIDLMEGKEIEL